MGVSIPSDVKSVLDTLSASDKETVLKYIESLQAQISGHSTTDTTDEPMEMSDDNDAAADSSVEHPKYDGSSGKEDYETADNLKQEAADAKSEGNYEKALQLYNQAVLAAPPSALLYANRAMILETLGHYKEAAQDCTWALELNPDSAKALKVRGKLRHAHLKDWHGALADLNQAQAIDFDPDVAAILKELTELRKEEELSQAQERLQKEEKARKRAEELKKAKAEAADSKRPSNGGGSAARGAAGGGMPGMGGAGAGMPGMGGMDPSMMAGLMSDPELQEAMKNPKVVAAFTELMNGPGGPMGLLSNPGKLQKLMGDPEVGPVLQKLMSKFMGGSGMPGGMGGMGDMLGGGMGGGASGGGDDDIPDLGEMPELD